MKKLLFAALIAITLGSCVKQGDITVLGLDELNTDNYTKPELTFSVENLSGSNIHLKEGRIVLSAGGSELLQIILADKVTIPRKSISSVKLPLNLKMSNPLAVLGLAGGQDIDISQMKITGELVVKAGMARKKIKLEDVPFSQFLSTFGLDRQTLENIGF